MALTSERAKELAKKSAIVRSENKAANIVKPAGKAGKHSAEKLFEISKERMEYQGQRMTRMEAAMRSVFERVIETGDAGALKKLMAAVDTGRMRKKLPAEVDTLESVAVVNELGKSETQHLNQRIQTSQLKGITAGLDGGKTYEEARISEVMNQYQGGIQAMLDGDPDAIKAIETKQALKQSNEEAHRIQHERLEAAGKKEAQDMMEKIRQQKKKGPRHQKPKRKK